MASSSKSDTLYSLGIRSVYPRVEGLVVSSAHDNMLFNIIYVMFAYYYIYLELGLV
jgi:hypothetical protein